MKWTGDKGVLAAIVFKFEGFMCSNWLQVVVFHDLRTPCICDCSCVTRKRQIDGPGGFPEASSQLLGSGVLGSRGAQ